MIAGTDLLLGEDVGPPPWAEIAGQESCKYATPACADRIATPWVRSLISRMRAGLSSDKLVVDIRWWQHLDPGDLPGLPHWHYDCYNELQESRPARHRIYFSGAGCQPMFEPEYRPPEGCILEYSHRSKHRIMPATLAGPRLLVRVSSVDIRPANKIGAPPLILAVKP